MDHAWNEAEQDGNSTLCAPQVIQSAYLALENTGHLVSRTTLAHLNSQTKDTRTTIGSHIQIQIQRACFQNRVFKITRSHLPQQSISNMFEGGRLREIGLSVTS